MIRPQYDHLAELRRNVAGYFLRSVREVQERLERALRT